MKDKRKWVTNKLIIVCTRHSVVVILVASLDSVHWTFSNLVYLCRCFVLMLCAPVNNFPVMMGHFPVLTLVEQVLKALSYYDVKHQRIPTY